MEVQMNLDLRKIVPTTEILGHKLLDLKKFFWALKFDLRFFSKIFKNEQFLTILEQSLGLFQLFPTGFFFSNSCLKFYNLVSN